MPVISTEAKRSGETRGLAHSMIIASALMTVLPLGQAQQTIPKPMSESEAKQFALAAVPPKLKALSKFELEPPNGLANGLYVFNAVWAGLPNGSVEVGFYAVDPVIGTVWNAVMECQQIQTPPLRRLQQRREYELRLSTAQLRRYRAKGPQCS